MINEKKNIINFSSLSPKYIFEKGALNKINIIVDNFLNINKTQKNNVLFIIDIYFRNKKLPIKFKKNHNYIFYNSEIEPSTEYINDLTTKLHKNNFPSLIVGIGGGSTLDVAKAISVSLTNPKKIEKYQGWNLLTYKGVPKIGVPTISGTGAESTKTAVLIDNKRNIKFGLNSDYSVFDFLVLDPNLLKTVPKKQYFYTAMDSFIHSFESLSGNFRNPISDTYSNIVIDLINQIFLSKNFKSEKNREKLMIASYLGGLSIANSYVGLVHPLSAGLSTEFNIHHCESNCLITNMLSKFYPDYVRMFKTFINNHNIKLKKNIIKDKDYQIFKKIYKSVIIHEKPLINALGNNYKKVITENFIKNLFIKI